MSHISRSLTTRLARLEAENSRAGQQHGLVIVPQYEGETPDTALQAAGSTSAEVSGSAAVFLQRFWPRDEEGDASQSLI